jgi:hypothetical protein
MPVDDVLHTAAVASTAARVAALVPTARRCRCRDPPAVPADGGLAAIWI